MPLATAMFRPTPIVAALSPTKGYAVVTFFMISSYLMPASFEANYADRNFIRQSFKYLINRFLRDTYEWSTRGAPSKLCAVWPQPSEPLAKRHEVYRPNLDTRYRVAVLSACSAWSGCARVFPINGGRFCVFSVLRAGLLAMPSGQARIDKS